MGFCQLSGKLVQPTKQTDVPKFNVKAWPPEPFRNKYYIYSRCRC